MIYDPYDYAKSHEVDSIFEDSERDQQNKRIETLEAQVEYLFGLIRDQQTYIDKLTKLVNDATSQSKKKTSEPVLPQEKTGFPRYELIPELQRMPCEHCGECSLEIRYSRTHDVYYVFCPKCSQASGLLNSQIPHLPCPACEDGVLIFKSSRKQIQKKRNLKTFLGCSNYPLCTCTRDVIIEK